MYKNDINYKLKYIKYKKKYLNLLTQIGGDCKKKNIKDIQNLNHFDLCLNLSRNKIDKLPEEINSFTNINELNLSDNKLENIDSIFNLSNLTNLNLSNNYLIGDLEKITVLTKLINLDLHNNYLNFSLSIISKFFNLEYLDVCNNTNIFGNIQEISMLTNLKYLNISNTSIEGNNELLLNFKKLIELDFEKTRVDGIFKNELLNLENLKYINFSIENLDFIQKNNICNSTIKNFIGSCWNLAIINIFLLGDSTREDINNYFSNNKTYNDNYESINEFLKTYKINDYLSNLYLNSIKYIKNEPDTIINLSYEDYQKLLNKNKPYIAQTFKKQHLITNKIKFNLNPNIITNFLIQINNRLKFFNIDIIDITKYDLIQGIDEDIEKNIESSFHEICPIIFEPFLNVNYNKKIVEYNDFEAGGFEFEIYNFCMLIGIFILKKIINFKKFRQYIRYSRLLNENVPLKNINYKLFNIFNDCKFPIENTIGIMINIEGHMMCFYKCRNITLFNNCYFKSITKQYDYITLFNNINFINNNINLFNKYFKYRSNNRFKNVDFFILYSKNENFFYFQIENEHFNQQLIINADINTVELDNYFRLEKYTNNENNINFKIKNKTFNKKNKYIQSFIFILTDDITNYIDNV